MPGMLLLLLLAIPALGAVVGAFLRTRSQARAWALIVSLATLAVAVWLATQFDFHQDLSQFPAYQRAERSVQINFGGGVREDAIGLSSIGFYFHLGIDSISLWLVLLTAVLQPLAIAASWESIQDRAREYYAWMLVLLAAMLGCFIARDLLLFYVFFELTLIPMFFIIGIWGGPERRSAAGRFFLFTFTGSVFTLAGVIYLGLQANTNLKPSFDILDIVRHAQYGLSSTERFWILLAFLAGFAVKVPLFPVHTWLPLAHTEAPTAGSVILAGVLLKLGTYGLLRFAVPAGLPDAAPHLAPVLAVLCIIGIIYGALVAWVQQDIKKLVAYSSVSHLGFCVLGLMALNPEGIQGSVMYMINHGLSTGALFLVIGMVYDRFHTRNINELSGLARRMPKFAFFFVLFALSSIGLPGLNGFVSEFLTVLGAFTSDILGPRFAAFAATGVILGAVYMLHMVARVIWGPLKYPHGDHGHAAEPAPARYEESKLPVDIGARELAILIPLAVLVIVIGVLPTKMMAPMEQPIRILNQPLVLAPQRPGRPGAMPPPVTQQPLQHPIAAPAPMLAKMEGK